MSSTRLLADNDILSLAAHWNLLDLIPGLADATWAQVACLPSLRHRARRSAAGGRDKLFRAADVAARLEAVLLHAHEPPPPQAGALANLGNHVEIDPGEQMLIVALLEDPNLILATGDKRALRALPGCLDPTAMHSIRGRIISTEHLLAEGLNSLGLAELQRRMSQHIGIDTAARVIMGAECIRPEREVREGLASYFAALQRDCQGLLRE